MIPIGSDFQGPDDPTMAAVARLVHHATILEFTGESLRADAAKLRQKVTRQFRGRELRSPPSPS